MVSYFVITHLPFILLPSYFILYTIQRIIRHWKDGKERARTSGGRLVIKLLATITCAIFELVHIADYSPNQNYSDGEIAFRISYFVLSGVAWAASSILVFFDYNRRLKAQWHGQRIFWILETPTNLALLLMNILVTDYNYSGVEFFSFSLIQIISYIVVTSISLFLAFLALFRPNDFTVISPNFPEKLEENFIVKDEGGIDKKLDEISLRISYTRYKIRQMQNSSLIQYKVNLNINTSIIHITRTLNDFEGLDRLLKSKFARGQIHARSFPEFPTEKLRSSSINERGQALCEYLNNLLSIEFMTPELIDFLNIEGEYRDILTLKHSQLIGERLPNEETILRNESFSGNYYSPYSTENTESFYGNSSRLQWIVKIRVLSHSQEDVSKEIDYYVKSKIPCLKFKHTKGFTIDDILSLHKAIKKQDLSIENPIKNYSILKNHVEDTVELRRMEIEHYLLEILNDPAFICKDALKFIGCDADLCSILDNIPEFSYTITDSIEWKGEIGEDSSHFIVYKVGISEKNTLSGIETEWKFSRRFREFFALNDRLIRRQSSTLLKNYLISKGKNTKDLNLPYLPGRSLAPLCTSQEIEERKIGLDFYIKELVMNPYVVCSYAFREFVDNKTQ
ncbi:hypothetical protein SteCoe_11001 [Stentor coeruleus]|uniref:PX domain-containing protein n=1 Tax=Stentor coeruleus TaxID=5963 RepID=A0A1R2CEC8_9CILI|nr:hypothetical protein SteCoe_11001 [Stentor coeruleus]